jgi:glycogen operon protein
MICHGDEIARTQKGNNNVYAQDNELAWMDWNIDERRAKLLAFTRQVFAIRHLNPVLRRRTFFRGQALDKSGVKDLTWIRADGQEMQEGDWKNTNAYSLGMLVHGDATDETDDRGRPIHGDTMVLLLNSGPDEVRFTLPVMAGPEGENREKGGMWAELVNTARDDMWHIKEGWVGLAPHSLVLLRYGRERRISMEAANANVAAVTSAGASSPTMTVGGEPPSA